MIRAPHLSTALAIAAALAGCASLPKETDALKPGLVLSTDAREVGAWRVTALGLCNHRPGCTYLQLDRPGRYAIALTEPIDRDDKGGILSHRVTKVFVIPHPDGDEYANCDDFEGYETIVGVINAGRHEVRLYGTDGKGLITRIKPYTDMPYCMAYEAE